MLVPADDLLHGGPADDPTWTETWWYPLYVPEAKVSAYLYAVVRPVAGVAAGGVIVWDDRTDTLFDALFADYRWAEPFEHSAGRYFRFRSGLSIEIVDPMRESRIRYDNPDNDTSLDVTFRATADAHSPSQEAKGKGIKGHFDQPGVLQGALQVGDLTFEVASPMVRDRSWGSRPDGGKRWWGDRIGYTTGAGDGIAFLAVSHPSALDRADVFDGFIDRDGARSPIRQGTRQLTYRPDGRIERVVLELVDDGGRELRVQGATLNRCTFQSIPAMMTTVSMVTWSVDGAGEATGEDQDVWWQHSWRRFARSRTR
ncbi:MAG: hypothetical protein ABI658_20300 [Acidimicrobiales bacterium]